MNIVDNPRSLLNYTKHTNTTSKEASYISLDNYPEQLDIVGTKVEISYRNRNMINLDIINMPPYIIDKTTGERIYSRPEDDYPFRRREILPPEGDEKIYREKFLVLRADAVEPFRLVAINDNYSVLLVNSTRGTEVGYEFETKISIYPVQYGELIGPKVYTHYKYDNVDREAYVLRADTTETHYSVLIEKVITDTEYKVRYLFEDEVPAYYDEETYHNIINTRIEKSHADIANVRKNIIDNIL